LAAYRRSIIVKMAASFTECNRRVELTSRFTGKPRPFSLRRIQRSCAKREVAEAKTALAEANRLNPKLTVKSITERYAYPTLSEPPRKAGLPEGWMRFKPAIFATRTAANFHNCDARVLQPGMTG